MKRIFMALGILLLTANAYAGLVTIDTTATITDSWIDNGFLTIYNDYNGNINTDNLAAGAVTSNDIATAANPLVRDYYNIGEYVYEGGLIITYSAASLAATIPACKAMVNNDGDLTLHYVVTSATSKTFTASKDTWIYLSYTGAFYYNEQATGSAQPTTPANHIILMKVVTNGAGITAVTDYRQTTPTNLRIYSNYASGCVVSRDATTATTITVDAGEIEFGAGAGGKRRNTASANIDFTTTGRGGLDTGSLAANTYYYLWALPDDGTDDKFDVVASLSSSDVTGLTNERLIGWCYANATNAISPDCVGSYKSGNPSGVNIIKRKSIAFNSTTSASFVDVPDLECRVYASGRPLIVYFKCSNQGAVANSMNPDFILKVDDALQPETWVRIDQANRYDVDPFIYNPTANFIWTGTLTAGPHVIKPQYRAVAGNTAGIFSRDIIIVEQ